MRILDNRYKIDKVLDDTKYFETYKVIDLWEDDRLQLMRLYHNDMHESIINYFVEEFISLSNISHENILKSEKFSIVKTINSNKTNIKLYYTIAEYIDAPLLLEMKDKLKFKEKLNIFLQILEAIDYIHFRGNIYGLLSPMEIYILSDGKVKLNNMAGIYEKKNNLRNDDFTRNFIQEDEILEKENFKNEDHYSLKMIFKYLFLNNYLENRPQEFNYIDNISKDEKKLIIEIIDSFNKDMLANETFLIQDLIKFIKEEFKIEYEFDLSKNRGKLNFNNKIVGREKELSKALLIDENIENGTNNFHGLIIKSDFGIGKSRLLNELNYRLKLKGRDVYFVEIEENINNDLLDMSNILKQSIKDTPTDIFEKYKTELSRILPELSLNLEEKNQISIDGNADRFRLYNRIANYFSELSKDKIIYIILDDIQLSNLNFLMLLDYLMKNVKSNNLFFIFSVEELHTEEYKIINKIIEEWKSDSKILSIDLNSYSLEEVGTMVQNILGMNYINYNFASVLDKECQGNPRYLEYIMKHLFNIGELYMSKSGKWYLKVDRYSDLYFPTDFDDAFKKQINIIKKDYFDIFKVMSIFENILNKRILKNMCDITQADLETSLINLINLKLINEKFSDGGYNYNISSNELKKIIYREIEEEEKIILHKKAADLILDLYGEDLEVTLEELTHHLIKSGQTAKALDLIIKAYESLDNKKNIHAILLLEKAYYILSEDSDIQLKLYILENLVQIYSMRSETDKSKGYFQAYCLEAERNNNVKHIVKSKANLVDVLFRKSQDEEAMLLINEIQNISESCDYVEGKITALSLIGKAYVGDGNLDAAESNLLEALYLADKFNVDEPKGALYNRLGLVKASSGLIEEAIENYQKSIFFSEQINDYIQLVKPLNNIGSIYMNNYSNSEMAMEYFTRGLEIISKYGIQELENVFLNNIGEVHLKNYELDKALECMIQVKKGSAEIDDLRMLVLSYINMGHIYAIKMEYDNLYECYISLEKIFKEFNISDYEVNFHYNNFLAVFYGTMGSWKNAIEHSIKESELCKEYNYRQHLKAESMIVVYEYLKTSYLNKDKIELLREYYRTTNYIEDRRFTLLKFAFISSLENEFKYAQSLLDEDNTIKSLGKIKFMNKLRESIEFYLDDSIESAYELISMLEKNEAEDLFNFKLYLNTIIGNKLYKHKKYKEAIKYFIESLDIVYKLSNKITDINLKRSYIKFNRGDLIKTRIVECIEGEYGKKVSFLFDRNLSQYIDETNLSEYFDITPIIDAIGQEDFLNISQVGYSKDILNVKNTDDLIKSLNNDYIFNLNLILNYLAKETYAKKGFIVKYDENTKEYGVVVSLDNKTEYVLDNEIINLVNRSKNGILVNSNYLKSYNKQYSMLLSKNIKGLICVPILNLNKQEILNNNKRKQTKDDNRPIGYIYLETDKLFNKFDLERLEKVRTLTYLMFINLESNRLMLMATTDKLTNIYNRKYFEIQLESIINNEFNTEMNFGILMIDIDKFKAINDTYGHRKGDEVLSGLGKLLKSTLRSTDIIARYGGEEFIVLLKNINKEQSIMVAKKINEKVKALKVNGISHGLTVSIGIALFPKHGRYKEDLIEKADQALYYAKETGRNKSVVWNPEMDNIIHRMDKLAGIITGNLEEENRNILALIEVLELIKENISIEDKIYAFLGRLIETIDAEQSTIIYVDNNKTTNKTFTRARFNEKFISIPKINNKIISKVIDSKQGEFLIDWDSIENIDNISGLPNWQSIIVLPLIKNDMVKGVLYTSVSLRDKEFDFNAFNLTKNLGNIFSAMI